MEPYYSDGQVTIYCGKAEDVLPQLRYDVIVTDPSYGTGGWRRTASGNGQNPSASLIKESWDGGALEWISLTVGPVLSFWPAAHTLELLSAAAAHGLTKHRCVYMRKRDPKPQVGGRIKWSVEPVWVLSEDGFVLIGGDDVYETTTPRMGRDAEANRHPYQKPLDFMRWLIAKLEPCIVCDPFAGSGSTLEAAKILGFQSIGIDQEEEYCEIAARRLQQGVFSFE